MKICERGHDAIVFDETRDWNSFLGDAPCPLCLAIKQLDDKRKEVNRLKRGEEK